MRRFVIAVGLVTGVTAAGIALDLSQSTASLLLLGAVVLAALRGRRAGLVAATAGSGALLWFFTPPKRALELPRGDDLAILVAFLFVAAVVGTSAARAYQLRVRAELRRREADLRLGVITGLVSGDPPAEIAGRLASQLAELLDLNACHVTLGATEAAVFREDRREQRRETFSDKGVELALSATAARPLRSDDRAVLTALVSGLSTALDNVRLEREAAEVRMTSTVNQMRESLLSLVSHNLRTPLAAIKASVATLQDGDIHLDPEERTELRETIRYEAERLEGLVEKLLDLNRIRSGGLELELEPVDVAEVAAAVVRRLRPVADGRPMRVEVAEDVTDVWADAVLLEQVFLNLLENAVRYSPPLAPIELTVRSCGDSVEAAVQDRGPGVPEPERDRVFEAFYRVGGAADSRGTGLGLAIVKALVAAHEGTVWCEEAQGDSGANFVFRIPKDPRR